MKLSTSTVIEAAPEKVWPLLCDSKMDRSVCCPFRLGVPKPVECRLPSGQGEIGAERHCVSDKGMIRQRITEWNPPYLLRFEMADTNLYFRPCVTAIVEEFELEEVLSGTRLTRTTRVKIEGPFLTEKAALLYFGLKFVHLYVFKNWRRLAAGKLRSA